MALALLLALIASFLHDAAAASGGAMGGGFASKAASSSRSRYTYSTPSTTHVYRDSCCGYRPNYTPVHQNGTNGGDMKVFFIAVFTMTAVLLVLFALYEKYRPKPSVAKLQVALKGDCSLQQDLNHIALNADTSTQEGYKYILEESAKALLRHSEYWQSSHLLERTADDEKKAESLFYDISFEERCKFDEETLVNIDNHQEQKSTWVVVSTSATPFIVVNVILATAGQLKLSPINSASDLKAILKRLGGLAKSEILAAHVLWTPQDESDHLSAERVSQDYPLLTELKNKRIS